MSIPCQYCAYPAEGEYRCDPAEPYMCGPCQKLLELDKKIKEIRTLLAGLKDERQVLKEEANHNHDRPFDSTQVLPPEIAADIFKLCIAGGIEAYSHVSIKSIIAPLTLSAVCRRWRIIAHSTPRLWNTITLRIRTFDSRTLPALSVVKEWIDRASELPLSITLSANEPLSDNAIQIINALNQSSNRWVQLEYTGSPLLLSHLPSNELDLPQLRTLIFNLNLPTSTFVIGQLNLHPTQLSALSITGILLVAINFDWQHLTQLDMQYPSLSECVEVFRRAPHLAHCTFQHSRGAGPEQYEFPLPQNPIVHPAVHYLEISRAGFLHKNLFRHLLCPSLKTLVLDDVEGNGDVGEGVAMPLIIEFLRRSLCSLERLSLLNLKWVLSPSDATSLCHGIPTLQHLHIDYPDGYSHREFGPKSLFTHLGELSAVNGRNEPRYLPALRSLTLNECRFSDWTELPNIFGTFTSHSMERHRYALQSVVIFEPFYTMYPGLAKGSELRDEETLKKIIRLREAGVNLKVGIKSFKKDRIDLAAEQYYGVQ